MVVPLSWSRLVVTVMAVLGRFGATRVEPVALFDPSGLDGPGPPADAIDVQFRAPLSYSLLVDQLLASGRELDAQSFFTVYEQAIEHSVERLQVVCGYVLDQHGNSLPARLELTALGESEIQGFAQVRIHHHVWVGATAETLDDGLRRPVDRDRLCRPPGGSLWASFAMKLRDLSEEVLGVRWAPPQAGAFPQITEPPVHELLAGQALGVCSSPWGARTICEQPTPEDLEWEAADVARLAERAAQGLDRPPQGRVLDY